MASMRSSRCARVHLLAAPRPSRLLCVRRPLAGRFVTGAKVTATDGGHQEPESATMSTSDLSQAKQSENERDSPLAGKHMKQDGHQQDLASQIEARGIACARELMLIQTVDDGDTEGVFNAVDADGNARVDLRELALALSKWTLLVTRPESPLAAAKNLALDLFMIFGVDPLEGFDSEQFRLVLQSWCLFTKIDFGVMARWLETALDLPDMQVTQEDKMAAEEITHAMSSPDAMNAAVEAHKIDLAFHLWDSDGDGVASRKKLTRALTWYYRLLTQVQEETGTVDDGSARRPEVIEFLEQEQRPGLPELDIGAFRKLVQRFCQLTNLPLPEICDFLLSAALTGGNTALDALADSGSDAPPLPGNIKGIMEDLRGQPEPDQAQPASTEGRHADTGGGSRAESNAERGQGESGAEYNAGTSQGESEAKSNAEANQGAAPGSQQEQNALE